MKIFNSENVAITVVSNGNADVVIEAKSFATIALDLKRSENPNGTHTFNSNNRSFYVEEEGTWRAKFNDIDGCESGADVEIYSGN